MERRDQRVFSFQFGFQLRDFVAIAVSRTATGPLLTDNW